MGFWITKNCNSMVLCWSILISLEKIIKKIKKSGKKIIFFSINTQLSSSILHHISIFSNTFNQSFSQSFQIRTFKKWLMMHARIGRTLKMLRCANVGFDFLMTQLQVMSGSCNNLGRKFISIFVRSLAIE